MIIKLFIFIVLLFSINITSANTKTIKITKNNTVLVNLEKNKNFKELIKSKVLKIELINNNNLKLVKDNNKIYFHITQFDLQEEGILRISYKNKYKDFPYVVNYKKNLYNFDIKNDFLKKRLQQKPLSCESSAASDIIYFLTGKYINEYEVYNTLDKDMASSTAKKIGNKRIWGNPNNGFVGYVDYYGKDKDIKPIQGLYTGYGVYEKPITKVFNTHGLETKIINKYNYNDNFGEKQHLKLILNSLNKGKMVQLWGDWCTDPKAEDGDIDKIDFTIEKLNLGYSGKNKCSGFSKNRKLEWYYKEDGELKKHIGLRGEHAFYLLGYEGDINNPKKIIVWDTDTGYHKYPLKEWLRKWKKMDYRSIIVSSKSSESKELTKYFKNKNTLD